MLIRPNQVFTKGVLLPTLITILVSVSVSLAIIDKNIRPIFVQTVVLSCFQLLAKSDEQDK
ncbi:hypothetical protein NIES2111_66170 (plasmid) [Nostoc sp. NIES-2111]|nr:hypothetical protein NIES2111_66170 [Nostoc sp. NIES-2111]